MKQGIFSILTLAILLGPASARADVFLDGSMGAAGAVSGPAYDIKSEYGRRAGGNLFHSFRTFSVDTGETAVFSGPDIVENIISRVTGGASSWIDGLIRSSISGADMYLVNPAGVMFGGNASLDVGGSFHVSTADYLRMADDERFYAIPRAGEELSSAPPSAFGFLDADPAPIVLSGGGEIDPPEGEVPGGLAAPAGETLSLIGGDVTVEGAFYWDPFDGVTKSASGLSAPAGRIQIAAMAGAGEVTPGSLDLSVSSDALGVVSLSDETVLDVSGTGAVEGLRGSGDIFIRGGQFVATESTIKADNAWDADGGMIDIRADTVGLSGTDIFSDAQGTGKGGSIHIDAAESLTVADFSRVFADAAGSGDAGGVAIETDRLDMKTGGMLSSDTYGAGRGGSVTVRAGSVHIADPDTKIFAGAQGLGPDAGDAGTIRIEAETFSLTHQGNISTDTYYGAGRGGDIRITGPDGGFAASVLVEDAQILSGAVNGGESDAGSGGTVEIRAADIVFSGGGRIGSQSIGGGRGGDVRLEADTIRFSGENELGEASRIYTTALETEDYAGDAGDIRLTAQDIRFTDRGGVEASTEGPGNAGVIEISAGRLRLDSGGTISSASRAEGPGGDAGRIILHADDGILLETEGAVTTETSGQGRAGNISVTAPSIDMATGARISSASLSAGKGGDAGVVAAEADALTMRSQSLISTASFGQGDAGDIRLTVGVLDMSGGSVVSSESFSEDNGGDAGTISAAIEGAVRLWENSALTTEALGGGGGRILVTAGQEIYLLDSELTSSVKIGEGQGGDINTSSEFVILNRSSITANADLGDGGAIFILTENYLKAFHSIISASSRRGNDGTVRIVAPSLDIVGGIIQLPAGFLDAARWARVPCELRSGETVSRFVIRKRDAAPDRPDDLQPSQRFWFGP